MNDHKSSHLKQGQQNDRPLSFALPTEVKFLNKKTHHNIQDNTVINQ